MDKLPHQVFEKRKDMDLGRGHKVSLIKQLRLEMKNRGAQRPKFLLQVLLLSCLILLSENINLNLGLHLASSLTPYSELLVSGHLGFSLRLATTLAFLPSIAAVVLCLASYTVP